MTIVEKEAERTKLMFKVTALEKKLADNTRAQVKEIEEMKQMAIVEKEVERTHNIKPQQQNNTTTTT